MPCVFPPCGKRNGPNHVLSVHEVAVIGRTSHTPFTHIKVPDGLPDERFVDLSDV
jgi:hypothetical protein